MKISWTEVTGATGYEVYRKTDAGSFSKLASIDAASTVTYTVTTVKSGRVYTYCVKAKNGSYEGDGQEKTIQFLSAINPTLTDKGKTIRIKWKKVTGATSYVIYRKVGSGSFKKLKTISKGKTVSYVDKKVKKGKKYTYYVYATSKTSTGAYVSKTRKKK